MPPAKLLSVIIPSLNEATVLAATIQCARLRNDVEIIVADGGSIDATRTIAHDSGARVVASPRGRGCQLAAGANAASGEILLFLHADTILPPDYPSHVIATLDQSGVAAGAFRLTIDGTGRSLRILERCVNWRSRMRQMPYGDQALFMFAATYRRSGGFPDIPMMEDYVLVRRLRRLGTVKLADASVTTSGRRWHEHGVWRTTIRNQMIIAAFHLGVSPERLQHWRDGGLRG